MNNSLFLLRLTALTCLTLSGAVQAGICQNKVPPSNPDSVYQADPVAGTVTDTRTGLMWKTCVEGQEWDGSRCNGTATTHTWAMALTRAEASTFADYDDWRLPNIKEMMSLVEPCRSLPTINDKMFPNTPSSDVWSGSPIASLSNKSWIVNFGYGFTFHGYGGFRNGYAHVRFVRAGQSFETFDLNVFKTGTGRGTVISTPAGIRCGSTCRADFATGAPITLTAKPDEGSTFGGWTGCTRNPKNRRQCTLTLTADSNVKASFRSATAKSDFVITGISLTPADPVSNELFSAEIRIQNQGTLTGDGGYLSLWKHKATAATCGATGSARKAVGSLAPGAGRTLTFTNLRAGRPGSKTFRAFVDSWCETSESDENNNQRAKVYTVK